VPAGGVEFTLRELALSIIHSLVDEPERASVEEVAEDSNIRFLVRVAPSDLGKLIGKQGRTANALRSIMRAAGMKYRRKVYVEVV
jgi:predicted RNA-binding protein YlqC (UPF0109 family)